MEIVSFKDKISASINEKVTENFRIKNNTGTEKTYSLQLDNTLLSADHSAKLCYRNNCSDNVLQLTITVPAYSQSDAVSLEINGGLSESNSVVKINVADKTTNEINTKEVFFSVSTRKTQDILYSDNSLRISNFFPNPAIESATIDYSLPLNQKNAKIVIQSVLGSIVGEYELDPRRQQLNLNTDNFKAGVYFYTLVVDDEGLVTRKLIVKK